MSITMVFPSVARAQAGKADRIAGFYLTYDDETGKEKSQVKSTKPAMVNTWVKSSG
jgi:hypothetical protein